MTDLKQKITAALPRGLKDRLKRTATQARVARNYSYDRKRFLAGSSSIVPPDDRERLAALITMDYHRIEKGLALPEPRPGFGQPVIARLATYARTYHDRYGRDALIDVVANVISEYRAFAREHDITVDAAEEFCVEFAKDVESPGERAGGTIEVSREDIWKMGKIDLRPFFASRYSVRNFSDQPVALEDIEAAVLMALKTPSVCNRQCGRVHYVTDRADIAKLLSFQNGNRGYGDRAGAVLLVCADTRAFATLGERNQGWIDGGLFAMSLAYALHSLGLGACMLNWSVEKDRDHALRKSFDIPENELVIMMMAVGHLPETLRVAQSPRRSLDTVLKPLAPS